MGVSTAHKHVHDQPAASKTWTFTHNLNTLAPIVDVFIETGAGLQKIIPLDVIIVDAQTLTVAHSTPRAGKVSVV